MPSHKNIHTLTSTTYIIHADLDAFFASVEQVDNPSLKGKPVAVGGRPEARGVVAAASYEARSFGIKSAMPMKTALRYCPNLHVISPRFDRYRSISAQVMKLFKRITAIIEPLSLDEAFLDITELVNSSEQAQVIAEQLRSDVQKNTGLTISIGIGTSKSVAKIASDLKKPNGLVLVLPGTEKAFLRDLSVSKLWGIGPKTSEKLVAKGITKIGDLSQQTDEWLESNFGSKSLVWKDFSIGKDTRPLAINSIRKSISAETTLAYDSNDPELIHELVNKLAKRVSESLHKNNLMARTIRVKLRLSNFTNLSRQTTYDSPTNSSSTIGDLAFKLIQKELNDATAIRLVGVGVNLIPITKPLAPPRQTRIPGL
jgi:DNA polymerase-4